MSYDNCFDSDGYDDRRSSKSIDQARDNLREQWLDEHTRESEILLYCRDHPHRLKWRVIQNLMDTQDAYIEEWLDEELADLRDDHMCRTNPHKYYGVSRYDFI